MKAKIKETKAAIAGEFSGHICFGERWYGFDDALYTAVRLLELLSATEQNVDEGVC
jgi:phosphomannomutase/phosphoglucomutase